MKLLYSDTSGEVFYAVYDKDWFSFIHSTNIALSEFVVDEVDPTNKSLCLDLRGTQGKRNSAGERKYYIQSNELYERDGWEEEVISPE